MNRILAVLVLLVVAVAGLGYYLGWFHLSTDNEDHKKSVTITVDKEKIDADKEKAKEKVEHAGEKLKDEATHLGQEIKAKTGATTAKTGGQGDRP